MKKNSIKSLLFCAAVFCAGNAFAANEITVNDVAEGWASYTGKKDLAGANVTPPNSRRGTTGGFGGREITVKTRQELMDAVALKEKKIIYVEGIIDMTDLGNGTFIPSEVTGTTENLDNFIKENTANSVLPCNSYKEWKEKYTASFNYTEDQGGEVGALRDKLNDLWRDMIMLNINSNTSIIGVGENAGIRGGSTYIRRAENVILRNLTLSDCYNPFPAVEDNDGLNADFDCVVLRQSKYVWVDHCTFYSSFNETDIEKDKYETKDRRYVKWQVYDGLCDIVNANDFVTVSWCIFRNHDKTMLIGNSDSATGDKDHQTITLHHNWFDSCTQRLPMVRFATIHIYNNVYTNQKRYGIDRRKDCKIYSECNYFEETIRSLTGNKHGNFYDKGSVNVKTENMSKDAGWVPSKYYKYTAEKAENAKNSVMAGAGAGKLTVVK